MQTKYTLLQGYSKSLLEFPIMLSHIANVDVKGVTQNTVEVWQTALSGVKLTSPAARKRIPASLTA